MKSKFPNFTQFSEADSMTRLGATIRRLRLCSGVSQTDLGKIIDVHQTAVCRIESGDQSVLPWQLQQLSELFGTPVTALLSGAVDYWRVAERFGQSPPLPERYREHPYSRVRDALPLLNFIRGQKGQAQLAKLLKSWGLDAAYVQNPDQPIGVNATLDLFHHLVKNRLVSASLMTEIAKEGRTPEVQGFLHQIYATQSNPLSLVKTMVLNAHHYQSHFLYSVVDDKRDGFTLVVKPASHMASVDYRSEELGDTMCRYRRTYLAQFPRYVGARPLAMSEHQCLFHGEDQCVYKLRTAS